MASELKCPSCGEPWDGDLGICHSEKVLADRRLVACLEDGTLHIDAMAEVDWESGESEHLHCRSCGHDWPVPEKDGTYAVEYV